MGVGVVQLVLTVIEQLAVPPPLLPVHVHVDLFPAVVTVDAVPVLQAPAVVPQLPLVSPAVVQVAYSEGPLPMHAHVQGPVPLTVVAVPTEQRAVDVGLVVALLPAAVPQTPTTCKVVQEAADPPLVPEQLQVHGLLPLTVEAVPTEQRPVVGIVVALALFAVPQTPLTAVALVTLQEAEAPSLLPLQVHVDVSPSAVTFEGVPEVQEPAVEPQAPSTFSSCCSREAEQESFSPSLLPVHVHVHGPWPLTLDAVPDEHRPLVGFEVRLAPSAEPQAPSIDVVLSVSESAEQEASEPPLFPSQVHVQGPVPLTFVAFP